MNPFANVLPACATRWCGLFLAVLLSSQALAAVTITPPANATAPAVINFGTYMDMESVSVTFFEMTSGIIQVQTQWNNQWNQLTCTPVTSWPTGKMIFWAADGTDLTEEFVEGQGQFTVSGGGTTEFGGGTNSSTTFLLLKHRFYSQTNASAPVLDEVTPIVLQAFVMLATNRTASSVTVTPPNSQARDLAWFSGMFSLQEFGPSPDLFELLFPDGQYQFEVKSAASNQQVSVNFTLAHPNTPTLKNYASLVSADPSKPLTLSWDAFAGGTSVDFIDVEIGDYFTTPDYGDPGALAGTATSVTVPAQVLPPNAELEGSVTFYRYAATTNSPANYHTLVARASTTHFTLTTGSAQVTPVAISKPSLVNGRFGFEIAVPAGLTVHLESATGLTGPWSVVLSTNSPGGVIRLEDPNAPGATTSRFYRVTR